MDPSPLVHAYFENTYTTTSELVLTDSVEKMVMEGRQVLKASLKEKGISVKLDIPKTTTYSCFWDVYLDKDSFLLQSGLECLHTLHHHLLHTVGEYQLGGGGVGVLKVCMD